MLANDNIENHYHNIFDILTQELNIKLKDMENLFIKGSDTKPTFNFNKNGNLKIEGKAIPENASKLFAPVFEWIEETNLKEIVFDIDLYYFNTAVSKQLFEMFMKAKNNENVKRILVKWRYEEGDDDTHESGLIYRDELPGIDFEFYEYAEI